MEISFDFSREDYVEYNQHVYLSPAIRRKRLVRFLKLSVMSLLAGSCLVFSRDPYWSQIGWGLICFSAVVSILPLLLDRRIMRRQVEWLIPRGPSKALYGPKRLKLDAEGFAQAGELMTISCKWQAIERIELTDSQVLFFYSPLLALVVPQRAFATGAALNEFLDTARRYHFEALQTGAQPIV